MKQALIVVMAVVLLNQGVTVSEQEPVILHEKVCKVLSKEERAALEHSQRCTIHKDELVTLLGQDEAAALLTKAQDTIREIEDKKFWNSVLTGLVISICVAFGLLWLKKK